MRPPGIEAEVKSAGFRMIFEDFSTKNEKKITLFAVSIS
jgi:hypothetical protein